MITFSIVSHNQGTLVSSLLSDIQKRTDKCDFKIILTLNVKEDEYFLKKFEDLNVTVIRNVQIKGFGANHNQAFSHCSTPYFIVCNPDIRLMSLDIKPLLDIASYNEVGVVAPICVDALCNPEDSARKFPSILSLIKRRFSLSRQLDYDLQQAVPIKVDWLAGMFMLFKSKNFEAIGGFDERFHMYFEDVDICYRLTHRNMHSVLVGSERVQHLAQRKSHVSLRHLMWHLTSAIRFFAKIRGNRSK